MTIGEVDWAALTEDPDTARAIPIRLTDLWQADEDAAAEAAFELHEMLCYAAVMVVEATVPAVRILYAMVAGDDFPGKPYALQLLGTIAGMAGVRNAAPGGAADLPVEARVHHEILHGLPAVAAAGRSGNREVRGAAIELLADASPDPHAMFEPLVTQFREEPDPVLQADLAYAATTVYARDPGAVGAVRGSAWMTEALTHPNPAVRYRVAGRMIDMGLDAGPAPVSAIRREAQAEVLAKHLYRQEYM